MIRMRMRIDDEIEPKPPVSEHRELPIHPLLEGIDEGGNLGLAGGD